MLSSKKKVVTSVLGTTLGALLLSSSLSAEVKFGGTAELDLFYRTNQIKGSNDKYRGAPNQEIAVVANVDGNHEVNSIIKSFNWRLATKVATDGRYDRLGLREAWIGGTTDFGTIRVGNQFSNIYLAQDFPYGSNSAGNVWADFGAHEVQYGRGISYFSPNLAGFTLSAQYDLGGKSYNMIEEDGKNISGDRIISSYAGEVLLTYDSQYVRLDAGYYKGVNSGTMNSASDAFGGSRDAQGSAYGTKENKAEEFYLGSILKYDTAKLFLGYSHNHWSGDTASELLGEDTRLNKFLVKVEYTFLDKNTVSLGYQKVFDSRTVNEGQAQTNSDGMNIINSQYSYMLTDNVSTFLQVRHHRLSGDRASVMDGAWQLDGKHSDAKNVTRVLIGAFMSF